MVAISPDTQVERWRHEQRLGGYVDRLAVAVLPALPEPLIGAAVVAVFAQLAVPLWPVPVTGQSLAVLLIGMAYGVRLGAFTVLLYVIAGAAGLPVFAKMAAGPQVLMGPAGGYIAGFVLASTLVPGRESGLSIVEWRPVSLEPRSDGTLRDRSGRFEDLFLTAVAGDRLELFVGQFRQVQQVDVSRRLGVSEPALLSASLPGTSERAEALNAAAILATHQTDTHYARQLAEEGLALSQELGNLHHIASAHCTLGLVFWKQKKYFEARAACEEGLALFRQLANPFDVADTAQDAAMLLDRLVRQGLVERARDAEDRRCSVARITRAGLELLARIDPEIVVETRRLMAPLTKRDARRLARLCDVLVPSG